MNEKMNMPTGKPKTVEFKDLNLSDDFLFAKVMEDKDILKEVLEKILEIPIARLKQVEPQKDIQINDCARGIRLDIYAADEGNTRYSVEMQKQNKYNVPKRSRYYHSTMDLDLLLKGEEYKTLPESYVIFICLYDEFQKGLHKYTFEKTCLEDGALRLCDGSKTILLTTCGTSKDVDTDLLALLNYIETSTDAVSEASDSPLVKRIHEKVKMVRHDKKLEVEYLTLLERYEEFLEEGRELGLEQGREQGRELGIEQGRELGIEQGRELGREEGRVAMLKLAGKLKKKGLPEDEIADLTGLPIDTIVHLEC